MAAEALFQPWSFKGLNLKNRLVMAPMTRSFSPGGVATEDVAQYYRRRAAAVVAVDHLDRPREVRVGQNRGIG
jgi:2,4-dienoyl-CoA reductase-like NADH-dependent reductase (Old Yellow Enzyme family)